MRLAAALVALLLVPLAASLVQPAGAPLACPGSDGPPSDLLRRGQMEVHPNPARCIGAPGFDLARARVPSRALAPDDDCGTGFDTGTGEGAMHATLPVTCDGTVTPIDDEADELVVHLDADRVLASHVNASGHVYLYVVDALGNLVTYDEGADVWLGLHLDAGDYFVGVQEGASDPAPQSYHLTIGQTPFANAPDCGTGADIADVLYFDELEGPRPLHLAPSASCTATLDVGDIDDAYHVETDGAHQLHIEGDVPAGMPAAAIFLDDVTGFGRNMLADASGHVSGRALDTGHAHNWTILWLTDLHTMATASVPYSFTLTTEDAPASNDCGSGRDLTWDVPAVDDVGAQPNVPCDGTLVDGETGDAASVPSPAGHVLLTFDLAGSPTARGAFLAFPSDVDALPPADKYDFLVYAGHHAYLDGSQADGGAYVWDARGLARETTAHAWTVRAEPDPQDDCGLGHDATRIAAHAELVPGHAVACRGWIDPDGDVEDQLLLDAQPGDLVDVVVNGTNVTYAELNAAGASDGDAREMTLAADGPSRLRIGGPGAYGITARILAPADRSDCGSPSDTTQASPWPIALPASCSGSLLTKLDTLDAFTFDAPGRGALLLRWNASAAPLVAAFGGPHGEGATLNVHQAAGASLVVLPTSGAWTLVLDGGPHIGDDDYAFTIEWLGSF